MLVITQDLIGITRVQNRQLVHAAKDFLQLAHDELTSMIAPQAIKALLKCSLDGPCERLASLVSEFSSHSLNLYALDTKGHTRKYTIL